MTTCDTPDVEVNDVPDELMREIKDKLKLEDRPVLVLAFNRSGSIVVTKAKSEFVAPSLERNENKTVKIQKILPAYFATAIGCTTTDTKIGGTSLTNEWPF